MHTRPFALLLLAALLPTALPAHAQQSQIGWTPGPLLNMLRVGHTATRLSDGRVLIAGGYVQGWAATAEVYRPDTDEFLTTRANLDPRSDHRAVLLEDGSVLVVGGQGFIGALASAETWDPSTGVWSGAGEMQVGRLNFGATRLIDGRVLVTGGRNSIDFQGIATADLYDPATRSWSPAAPMASARWGHTSTLLADGRVLVAGGAGPAVPNGVVYASAELYDPATNSWSPAGMMPTPHALHSGVRLHDGRVLVMGGEDGARYTAAAEIYDPASDTWTPAASMGAPRAFPEAVLLPSGHVLVAGGSTGNPTATSLEYDPAADAWVNGFALARARTRHTLTVLGDGRVLAAGGAEGINYEPAGMTELYTSPSVDPPPPSAAITSAEVVRKKGKWQLVLHGRGIGDVAGVSVGGVGFKKAATVVRDGDQVEIVQKGKLVDGRSIPKAIPQGQATVISVTTGDGATVSYVFSR